MITHLRQAGEKRDAAALLDFFQRAEKRSLEEEADRLQLQAEKERQTILSRRKDLSDPAALIAWNPYAVPFGHHSSGSPILWQVLDIRGSRALLLSRYALWKSIYGDDRLSTTWENSVIRMQLTDFAVSDSFSPEEKQRIFITRVTEDTEGMYPADQGHGTYDPIFLLSASEARQYFPESSRLECRCLEPVEEEFRDLYTEVRWWLRTKGSSPSRALFVDFDGTVSEFGADLDSIHVPGCDDMEFNTYVRPAMWINL